MPANFDEADLRILARLQPLCEEAAQILDTPLDQLLSLEWDRIIIAFALAELYAEEYDLPAPRLTAWHHARRNNLIPGPFDDFIAEALRTLGAEVPQEYLDAEKRGPFKLVK